MNNVIFFGDSICFGQAVSPHKTWVTRLSKLIDEHSDGEFAVINTSINGNTTRMALERMPHDVQSHKMKIILIQFGMNDCNYWVTDGGVERVSPPAFKANINEIINRARKFGAEKIILNTNHPTTRTENWNHVPLSYEESNKRYSEIIREISNEDPGTVLVDIRKAWENEIKKTDLKDMLLSDQLHLSEKGHELYYDTLKNTFISIIEDYRRKN